MVALTEVKSEDNRELANLVSAAKANLYVSPAVLRNHYADGFLQRRQVRRTETPLGWWYPWKQVDREAEEEGKGRRNECRKRCQALSVVFLPGLLRYSVLPITRVVYFLNEVSFYWNHLLRSISPELRPAPLHQ